MAPVEVANKPLREMRRVASASLQLETDLMSDSKTVVFVCVENSNRSQMAEAFLRHHGGDRFEAHSAGTVPLPIHPMTQLVMKEVGIDLEGQQAKGVDAYLGKLSVSHLVIVCEQAEQQCPRIWPGALQREFWPFSDPAAANDEEQLEAFRSARDAIEQKIIDWTEEQQIERE